MDHDVRMPIRVPRLTGTHADVLAAVGLASMLNEAAVSARPTVRVRLFEDAGAIAVGVPSDAWTALAAALPVKAGYPYVDTAKSEGEPSEERQPPGAKPGPLGVDVVVYAQERDVVKQYQAVQEQVRKVGENRAPADLRDQRDQLRKRIRSDWRQIQVLNTLQGDGNTNLVHYELAALSVGQVRSLVAGAIAALASGIASGLKWKLTLVQLFTPSAAKGYARLRPDGTDRNDKTKDQWGDPFLEWLKYRGYFAVACPYFLGSKGEHVRLLCPVPADISFRALQGIASAFRKEYLAGTAPKLDALAVLALARLLVQHSEQYRSYERSGIDPLAELDGGEAIDLANRTPADVISGVTVTHYQSLGNARAVSELGELALPGWFRIETGADAAAWLEVVDEHRRVVAGLQDDHSDEIGLLIQYRRFLEKRGRSALSALLEFMGAYGSFLLRAREQGRKVKAFQTDHFRRIVVGTAPDYSAILDHPGFQAVARAIRRATISAQYQKAKGERDYREIRYDLLPELRRKRTLPDGSAFLEALSDFIASYNTENARRREVLTKLPLEKRAPANVTTAEFAGVVGLVQASGAALVGAMLCAYGSCREPRGAEAAEEREEGDVVEAATLAASES